MKRTVFISHSSKDKAIGNEICRFLEANGISCWIASRDVTPGKNYGAAIIDSIKPRSPKSNLIAISAKLSGEFAARREP
jgi:hypothetical protein